MINIKIIFNFILEKLHNLYFILKKNHNFIIINLIKNV
jgi:hypothetical protein